MNYHISKPLKDISFDEVVDKVIQCLKDEGFGVLTDIDIKQTLKNKLDVDFKSYRILGAGNSPYAYQALQSEDYIGLMLPCNVVVKQELDYIDVAAVDPVASMQAVGNQKLEIIALEIRNKLQKVISNL
ncbi:MAG: DUF302 domain-containing protein [Cyclobacteriaceae bacterium]